MGTSREPDIKAIVVPEVDSYNVLSVLRAKYWGLDDQQTRDFVVGTTPTVTEEIIQKMINAEKVTDAIAELGNTVYRDIIPQPTSDIEAISTLEDSFEKMLLRKYLSAFRTMFTHALIISAIKLKMIEVRNLSAIASAVEQKMSTSAVMSKLLVIE